MSERNEKHLTEPPELMMLDAFALGGSGAVEAQEKRGQRRFAQSQMLPVRINSGGDRGVLEAWGVVFHDDDADDLFVPVDLPDGWKVEPTEHSMWSKLLDEAGRERASIFYKAAFYDRDAFLNISTRYTAIVEYPDDYNEPGRTGLVMDGNDVIHRTATFTDGEGLEQADQATAAATAWLNEHYPEWRDPLSYWPPRTQAPTEHTPDSLNPEPRDTPT